MTRSPAPESSARARRYRTTLTDVFDSVALYQSSGYRVGEGAGTENVSAMSVTPSFFQVLRTSAARGRFFTEEEGTPGRDRVVVLSHPFAAQQPGGVNGAVGRQIRLDDQIYDVVGVLPERFHFLSPDVRFFVPLAFDSEDRAEGRRYRFNHQQIARLAPGATLAQAQARVDAMNAGQAENIAPQLRPLLIATGYHTKLVPFEADLVRNVRPALRMLWGGILFVVLIAALNITNLSLVRATGRLKELATRNAVGAATGRIARQLITETTLLTLLGGALGLAVGFWSLDALAWLGLSDLPRAYEIRMDGTVFAFTLGLAVVLGIVVGLIPAAQLTRVNLASVLRDEGRSGTAGRRTRHLRRALVVSQVALAFVLIAGAGLLMTSFQRLLGVDPGFVADGVLTARVSPLATRYPDDNALRLYVSRALERIRALPGVEAAGITSFLPFSRDDGSTPIIPEGYAPEPGESVIWPRRLHVTPGYLEALGVKLVRGRFFTDADTDDAPRGVILDERLANRFWPDADPIGRRMYVPAGPDEVTSPGPNVTWLRVVGVVASVKLKGLVEEGEDARLGAYYFAYAQDPRRDLGFAVRGGGDPSVMSASVRRALTEIDPEIPASDVFTMTDRIGQSLVTRRAPMLLSLGFGLVALLLASIGLYGVLAYQVSQRTREFGIRLALGSQATGILRLVLREGAGLVLLGLVGGLIGAWVLRGVIASQLYGVGPLDPVVMIVATVVLATTSFAACWLPARCAARVDPMVALRAE